MSTSKLNPIIQSCIAKGHVTNEDARDIRVAIGTHEDKGERKLREALLASPVTYEAPDVKSLLSSRVGWSRALSFEVAFTDTLRAPAALLSGNPLAMVFVGMPLMFALAPVTSVFGAVAGAISLFKD